MATGRRLRSQRSKPPDRYLPGTPVRVIPGLNLSWETLEGIVKHNGPLIDHNGAPLDRHAEKGCRLAIRAYMQVQDLRLDTFASLEGQIAALADDIAYNNHDIDDGFRAGYIAVKELEEVPMAGRTLALVRETHGDLPIRLLSMK